MSCLRALGERLAQSPSAVVIDGQPLVTSRSPSAQARRSFCPEERLGHGTAPRMKLSDNALLTGHAASGMVNHGLSTRGHPRRVGPHPTAFDVRKPNADPEAARPLGGNLQNYIAVAKSCAQPGVLVVSQADLESMRGAAATIRQALLDLAARHGRAGHQPGP